MLSDIFDIKIKDASLALTAERFAAVLNAGIPLTSALDIIACETSDRKMKSVLEHCLKGIEAGTGLSEILDSHREIPKIFTETVRIGEKSGRLAEAFTRLREYYQKRSAVGKKIRTALRYPVFITVFALLVVWFITSRLTPEITALLGSYEAETAQSVGLLTKLSGFFHSGLLYSAVAIAFLIFACKLLKRTNKGSIVLSVIKLHIPVAGSIYALSSAGQFASAAAMLNGSGVLLSDTVKIAGESTDNRYIAESVLPVALRIENGESFGDAVGAVKYLPKIIYESIRVGELTHSLEKTLTAASDYCYREASEKTDGALSMLEPILTVAVGLFVALIIISVFIPMLAAYGSVGFWI